MSPPSLVRERARVRVTIVSYPLTSILSPEGRGDSLGILSN